MKTIEEINLLVKTAQYAPPVYPYKKTGDKELDEIFRKRYYNSDAYQRYIMNRERRLVGNRQMPTGRTTIPGAGRSWGSGYTGNEIRHGGTYSSKSSLHPRNYDSATGMYNTGNGLVGYNQLASTKMMQKWMDAGENGKESNEWKAYANESKRKAESYLPNNKPQHTYAGSLRPQSQIAKDNGLTRGPSGSSNEFGSNPNDAGVEGSVQCPTCGGRGTIGA